MLITDNFDLVRDIITSIVMDQCKEQHIKKMNIEEWEHGEPVQLMPCEYSSIVRYADGTVYRYCDIGDGAEAMTIEQIL